MWGLSHIQGKCSTTELRPRPCVLFLNTNFPSIINTSSYVVIFFQFYFFSFNYWCMYLSLYFTDSSHSQHKEQLYHHKHLLCYPLTLAVTNLFCFYDFVLWKIHVSEIIQHVIFLYWLFFTQQNSSAIHLSHM
jgi:hypothetical protein